MARHRDYQDSLKEALRDLKEAEAYLNASLDENDPDQRDFGLDLLLTYLVHPGTALYVGLLDSYENLTLLPGALPGDPREVARVVRAARAAGAVRQVEHALHGALPERGLARDQRVRPGCAPPRGPILEAELGPGGTVTHESRRLDVGGEVPVTVPFVDGVDVLAEERERLLVGLGLVVLKHAPDAFFVPAGWIFGHAHRLLLRRRRSALKAFGPS